MDPLTQIYTQIVESSKVDPDFDFDEWLQTVKHTKNEDGSINVEGNVKFHRVGFTKLPCKFKKVTGSFYCYTNNLETLEGCPEWVGGTFNCGLNHLTSLVGGPEYVGGNYICSNNSIENLQGIAQYIEKNFDCTSNNLKSLDDLPEHIGGDVYAAKNFYMFKPEYVKQSIEKAKTRKYIKTLSYDNEVEGMGDIFD